MTEIREAQVAARPGLCPRQAFFCPCKDFRISRGEAVRRFRPQGWNCFGALGGGTPCPIRAVSPRPRTLRRPRGKCAPPANGYPTG